MRTSPTLLVRALVAPALLVSSLPAQAPSRFAARVVQFTQGSGSGIFTPANLLGHPRGGGYFQGSLDVLSLGEGGSVTVGFDVTIADGPGADFSVCENPFFAGTDLSVYQEPAFVEVSTDGLQFARFPTRYDGASVQPGPFDPTPIGIYSGFTGAHMVMANDLTAPGLDPFDPCLGGGDAFDLHELIGHPLVQNGAVRLDQIHFVRIVDVVSGVDRDSAGRTIFAPVGGADLDAVCVIHDAASRTSHDPNVQFTRRPDGRLELRIEDPDGLGDLDPASLTTAIDGLSVPFDVCFTLFQGWVADPTGITLVTSVAIPPSIRFTLGCGVRDRAGARAMQRWING